MNTGRGIRNRLPMWVVFAVTGILILGMFTWFDIRQHQIKDAAVDKVNALVPLASGS